MRNGNPRTKVAAAVGLGALAAAATLVIATPSDGSGSRSLAGGSGDSPTGTSFVQPTVPSMDLTPAMTMGATVTAAKPAATLLTSMASPTFKASPEAVCVNNGQCP